MEFTVIGDTVNRAARLESLTRNLGASVLFDRETAERLAQAVAGGEGSGVRVNRLGGAIPQGTHAIKGLGEVEVFSPALGLIQPDAT
jgi:hypothetical protein